MSNITYKHYGTVDDMGRKWRKLAASFARDAKFLEASVYAGERSWEDAFRALRYGFGGPVSDQDMQEALRDLRRLNPSGMRG